MTPQPESPETLYTSGQASLICGIERGPLQTFIDRDYIPSTVVHHGARVYRRFTRQQLITTAVFAQMVENDITPKRASLYAQQMESSVQQIALPNGPGLIVFTYGGRTIPRVLDVSATAEEIVEEISLGAYVVHYPSLVQLVDHGIAHLISAEAYGYTARHPEKFGE